LTASPRTSYLVFLTAYSKNTKRDVTLLTLQVYCQMMPKHSSIHLTANIARKQRQDFF